MIPNVFKILRPQRIVLIIITLLIMLHQFIPHVAAEGRPNSWEGRAACNAKTVKLKPFFNKAANAFLAIKNGNVTTVSSNYNFVYTITAGTSHQFFIYQIEEKKFICYMKGKRGKPGRFVSRRIPHNAFCLFNQTASEIGGYSRLLVNDVALQFNKSGKQVPDRSAIKNARHHKQRADFAEFTSSKCVVGDIRALCKTFRNLKRYPKDLQSLCKDERRHRV